MESFFHSALCERLSRRHLGNVVMIISLSSHLFDGQKSARRICEKFNTLLTELIETSAWRLPFPEKNVNTRFNIWSSVQFVVVFKTALPT
jgi:hypothetical protein